MAIIKCEACGGDLKLFSGSCVAECLYCGKRQTVPLANSEKKLTLFSRASRLLRDCEFDKAAALFENLVAEFPDEAKAYWCLVLCKYGIEYVDDPATGKKIPTCHRSSFDSVLDDGNFKQACDRADPEARELYRAEAGVLEALRRNIIEASVREAPYDIFICYKETDENGDRTLDSVLAQDIYDMLTKNGYRVFFSRVSLEDKLGQQYEPCIFAALNSARIMLVVGTDYDHFNAVWVKNEWSRFLKLIASGQKKILIPCYKGIDAYDMPKEFAKLQAQDLGKLGAMQDLLRGVDKIMGGGSQSAPTVQQVARQAPSGPNEQSLLRRGQMELEDGWWDEADDLFNRVLDMDAECAGAHLGRFLASKRATTLEKYVKMLLADTERVKPIRQDAVPKDAQRISAARARWGGQWGDAQDVLYRFDRSYTSEFAARRIQSEQLLADFDGDIFLRRAKQYADEDLSARIAAARKTLSDALSARIEDTRAADAQVVARIRSAYARFLDEADAKLNRQIEEAEESARRQREADEYWKKERYKQARRAQRKAKTVEEYYSAECAFWQLGSYRDSNKRARACQKRAYAIEDRARRKQKRADMKNALARRKKPILIAAIIVTALILYIVKLIIPSWHYQSGETLLEAGDYQGAMVEFEAAGDFDDAQKKLSKAQRLASQSEHYTRGESLSAAADYRGAIAEFEAAGDYSDAQERLKAVHFDCAEMLLEDGDIDGAIVEFEAAGDYSDAQERLKAVHFDRAGMLLEDGDIDGAIVEFEAADDYGDAVQLLQPLCYDRAQVLEETGMLMKAAVDYGRAGNYADALGRSLALWDKVAERKTIAAGFEHSAGLMSDGKAVAVGKNYDDQCNVAAWSDIVAVATGYEHTVALRTDGTVVATGEDFDGQCNVSDWTNIVAVAAGYEHTVALRADGTVVAVGDNGEGQCNVSNWTDIVSIAAGDWHTVGLKSNGTVVAVGNDSYHICDVSGWRDIVAIAAGRYHTVGLKSNGRVVAVGDASYHRCDVSDWTDIVAVAAGGYHTVGLKSDGTVVAVGYNDDGRCDVSRWKDIVAIAAGGRHTLGLRSNGKVVATGDNDDGQCEVSSWKHIRKPE